jgi:hypothetical protein
VIFLAVSATRKTILIQITFFVPLPLVKVGIGVRLVDSEDAVDRVGGMAA